MAAIFDTDGTPVEANRKRYEVCLNCLERCVRRPYGLPKARTVMYATRGVNGCRWTNPWHDISLGLRNGYLPGYEPFGKLCHACPFAVEHVTLAGRELDLVSEEDMIP